MGDTDLEPSPEKKAKYFCPRTFRQELKGHEVLKSLKRFISAAKISDDVVYEYLECGGSLQEILSLLDVTARGDLTTALPVFEVTHLILTRFPSLNSKHHQKCLDGARTILNSHLLTIKSMLTMNVTKQKKVALKLLTAMVTLHSSFATEIMNVMALSPTLIADLIQLAPDKESVRKYFILFILSFLVDGNTNTVKNLLDKKGFLSSIIPGLKFDEATTVNLTLSLFEDKILKNIKIPKTLKLKLFNTQIIKSLFDLYDWKGPQSTKQLIPKNKNKVKAVEVNQKEKELVVESVHSFLLLLCCSTKFGVAFVDKSMGTSDQLNNQLLLTVFESLPDPLKNNKIAEVLLKTIATCPDLMKPVLLKLEPSFQPRDSKNWYQAVDFAENLLIAMEPVTILKSESESGPPTVNQVIRVGKTLCTPAAFLRMAKLGSQKSQPMEIRLRSLRLLAMMWTEVEKLAAFFQKLASDFKKSMNHYISKFLPDAGELVELWHNLCDPNAVSSSATQKSSFLSAVLKSLHIIVECQKDAVSAPLDLASDMLRCLDLVKETMDRKEFDKIQVEVVEFVEMDLQTSTPDMELFEKSLLILLRCADESCLSITSKILSSLNMFERNKAEVEVWLLSFFSLPEEYRSLVADLLIESFRRVKTSPGETRDDPLTGLIFDAMEVLKCHSKDEKGPAFRHFISDVVIHLQHFYQTDDSLHDQLHDFKKILSKSAWSYLKGWKSDSSKELASCLEVFSCPKERDLVSWLLSDKDTRTAEEVIPREKTNLLKLYSLFQTVLAYLTRKTANGDVGGKDAGKFTAALSLLLKTDAPADEDSKLISFDLKNESVYKGNCLSRLFQNEVLLGAFDVFSRKQSVGFHATGVVFRVLMVDDKDLAVKRSLSGSWKEKFLKQLKGKLKKCKEIDGVENLEAIVHFFDYEEPDVTEMVKLFMEVSDFNLFVNGKKLSAWVIILSKFVKMHSQIKELTKETMKTLCSIMKHLSLNCYDLKVLDDCFVYILRQHPRHLLLVEDDFLEVILRRTKPTPTSATLGKLLLNDPKKVSFFLKLVTKNLESLGEPELVFSLLSVLIIPEDSFLGFLKPRGLWISSQIQTSPEIFQALKALYEKFGEMIFQAMAGEEDEMILNNLDISRELIKLFTDKKNRKQVKKGMAEGKFQPELVFEAVKKLDVETVTDAFIQGLLTMFCRLVRNSKDGEEEPSWPKYCSIVENAIGLKKNSWEKVSESSEWKEFAKSAIGRCFTSMKHPSLLKIFRLLVTAVIQPGGNSRDATLFFQMLISHSHFLNVIMSKSPLKTELFELFLRLIERCPSEMSPKHVPILLAPYTSTLSPCDQILIRILRLYEKSGVNVSDYEPFVWGEAAVSHYSIGTNPGLSLWQRFNMGNVLDLLDEQRMRASLAEFPIHRTLEVNENLDCSSEVYDPAFLLPLFVNLLSPGSLVFCLPFIYKGALGYSIRALSSESKDVRMVASVVLTRFYSHLELSQNMKQKLVWMHFINCVRFGIEDLSSQPLPNIISLFFSRMTLELSSPPAEMYLPLQNFLLAKSYFVLDTIPEFLPLFHSSEVAYGKHRQWLLEVLRDGTRTSLDLNVIFHSMAIKVIFCFFHSQLCDNETKKLILQVMERMLRVKKSIFLISEYGLFNWLNSIESFQGVLHDLLKLLSASASVIIEDIKVHKCKHANPSHLIQILNISMKVLPGVKSLKSAEVFEDYLKSVLNCLSAFTNEKKSEWFRLNKNRIVELIETGVVILGGTYDCNKFREVEFYFRDHNNDCKSEVGLDLKNCVYLFDRLICKSNNGNT